MPFIGGGGDPQARTLELIQMIQARRERQGKNKLALAKPGDTIGSLGIDQKTFQSLYGKEAKYDPNMVVSEQTAAHKIDQSLQSYLDSLNPVQLLDVGASAYNSTIGTPGATTVAGAEAARQRGGTEAQVAADVSKNTAADRVAMAGNKAKTELVQSETGKITAQDVAARTMAGIESWKKAPENTQNALNQTLTYGTTGDALTQEQFKQQLATSSLRQAILAQTDPAHPIHGFLKKLNLDLNTVLAGTAMGITTMFDDYNRYWQSLGVQNKEASNIMLRMYTDTAKQMSESIFQGKLTPGQVLTIMKSREEGTALPTGMQEAAKVYDLAVQTNFDAAMQAQLQKGDPFLQGAQQALANLTKITDGRQLEATQQLTRYIAAYAATRQQMGVPSSADDAAKFDALLQQNLRRAISSDVKVRVLMPNQFNMNAPGAGPAGAPPPTAGLPDAVAGALAPRPGQPGAAQPAPMPAGLNMQPVGGAPANPVGAAMAGLSTEDQQVLTQYLQSIGALGGAKPKVPPR